MKKQLAALVTAAALLVPFAPVQALAAGSYGQYGFAEVKTQSADGGTYHLLEHADTGARVVWLDNGSESRSASAPRLRTARAQTTYLSTRCCAGASSIP